MSRVYLTITAVSGFLVVALGAFGAHALNDVLSDYQHSIWNKAVLYQMFHTAALGLTVLLAARDSSKWLNRASACFTAGIVLFSGSLYALALSGISKLGIITPFGGMAFLLGWLALGIYSRVSLWR